METPTSDFTSAFTRIEREVEAGNTDLAGLGFWRLVDEVKREPELVDRFAGAIARIDAKTFERAVKLRFPLWLAMLLLVAGIGIAAALVPIGIALARGQETVGGFAIRPRANVGGAVEVLAALGLAVTVHGPAHFLVGRLVGIRFSGAFIGGPLRLTPGVKIDYASYLRASARGRAAMHAAGALASKIAPFAVFAAVYLVHRNEGYHLFPSWALWGILAIGLAQILTDILWSTKTSDWKKVRRELRVAKPGPI